MINKILFMTAANVKFKGTGVALSLSEPGAKPGVRRLQGVVLRRRFPPRGGRGLGRSAGGRLFDPRQGRRAGDLARIARFPARTAGGEARGVGRLARAGRPAVQVELRSGRGGAAEIRRLRAADPRADRRPRACPMRLTDIRATVHVDNGGYAIDDLTARSGQATLRMSCRRIGLRARQPAWR